MNALHDNNIDNHKADSISIKYEDNMLNTLYDKCKPMTNTVELRPIPSTTTTPPPPPPPPANSFSPLYSLLFQIK